MTRFQSSQSSWLETERLYRIRIGDYRIVYGVDKAASQVIVHYVRHRRQVYGDDSVLYGGGQGVDPGAHGAPVVRVWEDGRLKAVWSTM